MTMKQTISAVFIALALAFPVSADDASWELTPYRVHLTVQIDKAAGLSPAFEQTLTADLTARLKAAVGGAWNLTVEAGGDQPQAAASEPKEPKSKTGAGGDPSPFRGGDKVLHLRITRTESGFRLEAQDIDELTHLLNAPVARECASVGELGRQAAAVVLAGFAPLARIDSVQGDTVRLRLKAAALYPRDVSPVASGIAFRPVLMKSDSSGKLSGLESVVPWTYLVPTGAALRSTTQPLTCDVVTGLADAPLPDYHPHRQRLALGVSHSSSPTALKIVTDDGQNAPQEGYEVVEESAGDAGQSKVTTRVDASGTDGVVEVPPGKNTVRMLVVRHGDIALARLPMVPGLERTVTLPLPPAGQRVAIAAALASLEDDLIDRLARQQVFDQRIAAATADGDTAAADKLRGELRNLPAANAFIARLTEQEQALAKADATAQRLLTPKIAAIKKVIEQLTSN